MGACTGGDPEEKHIWQGRKRKRIGKERRAKKKTCFLKGKMEYEVCLRSGLIVRYSAQSRMSCHEKQMKQKKLEEAEDNVHNG